MGTPALSTRIFAAAVGAALAIVGFVALALTITVTGGISCGNGLAESTAAAESADASTAVAGALEGFAVDPSQENPTLAACDSAVNSRRAWAWPLVGVGVVVAAGAGIVGRRPRSAAS